MTRSEIKAATPEHLRWTTSEAVELCRQIEAVCPAFGFHVALTGGLLYKDGVRNDCDIVLYRIRQVDAPDFSGLMKALGQFGLTDDWESFGFCTKAFFHGKSVDIFLPRGGVGTLR